MRFPGLCVKLAVVICLVGAAYLGAQDSRTELFGGLVAMNLPHPSVEVPGSPRKMHTHQFNRVMIYMHPGGEDLHFQDGHVQELRWQAGSALWSPVTGLHYSVIPKELTPPFTGPMIVEVNLMKDGDPKKAVSSDLDGVSVDPKDFKLELDNAQVRVIRLKIGPHQSVPMHEHLLNYVLVPITDENIRETSADGKSETVQRKAAQYAWRAPAKYKIENLDDKPYEAVIVEVKN
jgi:beta-alanine degradation protein BauB